MTRSRKNEACLSRHVGLIACVLISVTAVACSGASWTSVKSSSDAHSSYTAPQRVRIHVRASAKADGVDDARNVLDQTVRKALGKRGIEIVEAVDSDNTPRLDLEITEWSSGSGAMRLLTQTFAGGARISVRMRLFVDARIPAVLDGTVVGSSESGALTQRSLTSMGLSAMAAPEDAGLAIAQALLSGKLN